MSWITKIAGMFLISAVFLFMFLNPLPIKADSLAEFEIEYEGEILASDPLLVNSMKLTMYEFVADDEEIDIVSNWIKEGAKNDAFFESEVLEIMKLNCTKCHNVTSTMSDAVPDKPLTSYLEIKQHINPGLPAKPSE